MDKVEKTDYPGDRRRKPRTALYHPIVLQLYSRSVALPPLDGFLKDISLGGARIALDDPHGRFQGKFARGLQTRLQITLPEGDALQVPCLVAWVSPAGAADSPQIEVGLEFAGMEGWQLEKIELFMSARRPDQTMRWNLWDSMRLAARRHS